MSLNRKEPPFANINNINWWIKKWVSWEHGKETSFFFQRRRTVGLCRLCVCEVSSQEKNAKVMVLFSFVQFMLSIFVCASERASWIIVRRTDSNSD